jgi:ubiquinone/menaquinone biosynthesis C-methylase UbiE
MSVTLVLLVQTAASSPEGGATKGKEASKDPKVEGRVKVFENPNRPVVVKQQEIIEACAITPGMVVADIGAGTGLYTIPFAGKVGGKGTVYAVEISKSFLEHIEKKCKEQNITNVRCIESTDKGTGLEDQSSDLVFLCDTYHHFTRPEPMLAAIKGSLREDGRLVVVDRNTKGHAKFTMEEFKSQVDKAGFKLVEEHARMTSKHFLMVFRKK